MGPVNYPGVVLGALVAALWAWPWFRLWGERPPAARHLPAWIVPAWLVGHNFARVGTAVLAAKPWLYWMMSGGWALMIVLPALWLAQARAGQGVRAWLVEGGYFLTAFLAMGTVFRLLG